MAMLSCSGMDWVLCLALAVVLVALAVDGAGGGRWPGDGD